VSLTRLNTKTVANLTKGRIYAVGEKILMPEIPAGDFIIKGFYVTPKGRAVMKGIHTKLSKPRTWTTRTIGGLCDKLQWKTKL